MSSRAIVSHVSIAVTDLEKSVELFQLIIGQGPTLVKKVPEQKVNVAIFSAADGNENGGNIELASPASEDSPIGKFLQKRGEGLHHVCIYIDDLERKLSELKARGIRLIDEAPHRGAEGQRIAFIHPSACHGVLIELQERSK